MVILYDFIHSLKSKNRISYLGLLFCLSSQITRGKQSLTLPCSSDILAGCLKLNKILPFGL